MEQLQKLLLDALRPFAEEADKWDEYHPAELLIEPFPDGPDSNITVGDLRRAKTVYDSFKG
jgi:hypothetical protein